MNEIGLAINRKVEAKTYTQGELWLGEERFCFVLERPRFDPDTGEENARCTTCFKAGRYKLRLTWSARFNRLLPILEGVPGRDAIRIHAGNKVTHSEGCPLVGERKGVLDGEIAVLDSRAAEARLVEKLVERIGLDGW
ncbi:MAG: hypothetical protein KKB70_01825 [Proteobacteria bacterium]|nr:hypothetical protein [Pseudomonadota bacterium]MBU1611395.1 hypothetical protein [Pseudomonadota bacterium]